jgi:hypothetical protein
MPCSKENSLFFCHREWGLSHCSDRRSLANRQLTKYFCSTYNFKERYRIHQITLLTRCTMSHTYLTLINQDITGSLRTHALYKNDVIDITCHSNTHDTPEERHMTSIHQWHARIMSSSHDIKQPMKWSHLQFLHGAHVPHDVVDSAHVHSYTIQYNNRYWPATSSHHRTYCIVVAWF